MKKILRYIYIVVIAAVIIFFIVLNITSDKNKFNDNEKTKIISEFKENHLIFEEISNALLLRNKYYINIYKIKNQLYFGDGNGNVFENIDENLLEYSNKYFEISEYKESEISMVDSNTILFSYYYSSNNTRAYIVYLKNDVPENYYEKICDNWYFFYVRLT